MAADEKPKFIKNWITSKWLVLYAPNLVCVIYSAPETSRGLKIAKFIIQDGRRPPSLNNCSSDFHQIWHKASPWHHRDTGSVRTAIFLNPRWPPAAILKCTNNLNNCWTVSPIFTKFGRELHLDSPETPEVLKPPIFKIQDGLLRKTEIY